MKFVLAIALALAGGSVAFAEEVAAAPGALLRGLDKVSGLTTDIELARGHSTTFGRLSVTLSDCRYPVGDPASNAYAFLTIADTASGASVFEGWMIASSPALSALDDPRYDVWVLRCISS
ncbi:MAG: DUF2155 domain-containing protein [Paracoccaceae bacterium]